LNRLLFVCGFPSSGTDLTKTILNTHPDIYLNGEMPLLHNITKNGFCADTKFTSLHEIRAFQTLLSKLDTWNNIENLGYSFTNEIESKKELNLEEVLKMSFTSRTTPVWGNKTPQNTEHISELADLFPQAFFLVVVRDVRDVCLSWRNKWSKDMIWCAEKWAERMEEGWLASQQIEENRCLFIKYEDILLDTEPCLRKVCEFLGLPFSHQMLEHQKYTSKQIDGKLNYGRKIIKANTAKWRYQLPSETLARIEEIAFNTMKLYDYEAFSASGPQPISGLETVRGVLNGIYAVMVIGNRAKNQNNLTQRIKELIFHLKKRILR